MGQTTDEQHYSLRWSDYHHNMMTSFRELQDQEEFVDVTISADGLSMQAHKVVLSACSPYFRKLLKSNPCQHPIVILQNVSPASLESLLRFMYNGEVQVSHEQLSEFLRTAELLQVKGLSETGFKNQQTAAPAPMPEADSLSGRRSADSLPSPSAKRPRPAQPEVSTPTPSVPLPPSITAIPTSVLTAAASALENNNHKQHDPAAEQLRRMEEERERAERAAPPPLHHHQQHQHHHQQQHQQHQEKYGLERLSGMDKYPGLEKLSSNMEKLGGMGSLLGIPGFGSGLHQSAQVNHMQTGPSPDQQQQQQQPGFRRGMDMFRLRATDPRPCNICGKIYKNAHTLRTHMEDKHSQCAGFRCVLCGTVAKSRNSLHSHMSRQHRGISTRDLPLLPMPAPWDPELAARFIARSGGRGEVVRQSVSRWEKSMSSSPVPSPGAGGQENGASTDADPYRVNLMHQLAAQAVTSAANANGATGGGGANGGGATPGAGGGATPAAPGSTGSAVLDTYLQMMAEQGLDLSVGVTGPRRPPVGAAPPAGSDDEEEPDEADDADADGDDKDGSDRSDEPDNGDKENVSCSGGTSDRDGSD